MISKAPISLRFWVRGSSVGVCLIAVLWANMASSQGHAPQTAAELPSEAQRVEEAMAEALFRKGRELMALGNFGEACRNFEESYRIDPATGTLLNLATCQEAIGRLATAWLQFSRALELAKKDARPDRVRFAEERLRELAARLPWISFKLQQERPAGLEVRLDGVLVSEAALDVSTPLDPGKHRVEAQAPGKKPWVTEVDVQEGIRAVVEIPLLEEVEQAVGSPSGSRPEGNIIATPVHFGSPPAPPTGPDAPAETTSSSLSTHTWVLGASTAALSGAALLTGVIYLDRRADYRDARAQGKEQARLRTLYDDAHSMSVANTVFVASALGTGLLTVYFAVSDQERPPRGNALASPKLKTLAGVQAGCDVRGAISLAFTGAF